MIFLLCPSFVMELMKKQAQISWVRQSMNMTSRNIFLRVLDRIVDWLQRPHFLVNGAVACDDIDLKRLNFLLLWRESDYDEDINFVWHCTWFHIRMKWSCRRYRLCLMMTLYLVPDHRDQTDLAFIHIFLISSLARGASQSTFLKIQDSKC